MILIIFHHVTIAWIGVDFPEVCFLKWLTILMSQSIPTGYVPPGQPPGVGI